MAKVSAITVSALYSTREPEMKYQRQGRIWRFVSVQDGRESTVGYQYGSRAELMADIQRYLTEWGYA